MAPIFQFMMGYSHNGDVSVPLYMLVYHVIVQVFTHCVAHAIILFCVAPNVYACVHTFVRLFGTGHFYIYNINT